MSPDARRHAPATGRNRAPILAVLERVLPQAGTVLEVASGTGEHAVAFAGAFPRLAWQPSDPDAGARESIAAWRAAAALPNLLPPVALDAAAAHWPIGRADAMLCINMIHIAPWSACLGLMAGARRLLGPGAPLYLYGPYLRADVETAPGNLAFDRSLRTSNPDWGVRHLADVEAAAAGFRLTEIVEMPANNLSLVFRRAGPATTP